MAQAQDGTVSLSITPLCANTPSRGWLIRVHLLPYQTVRRVKVDGISLSSARVVTLQPMKPASVPGLMGGSATHSFMPFGGVGTAPPPLAGVLIEFDIAKGVGHREAVFRLTS
jgi:hypothetical protein